MLRARVAEARQLCEEAVELARSIGARDLEGHALNTLGILLSSLGEGEAAIESSEAALGIAVELGIPDDIGRAQVNLAEVHAHVGYPERALQASYVGMEAASDWGVARTYGSYIAHDAVQFAYECGDWVEAARLLAEGDRAGSDDVGTLVYRAMYALELLACRGDPAAEEDWRFAREMVSQGPSGDNLGTIYLGGIELAAFAGRYDEAVDIAWEGFRVCLLGEFALRYSEMARVAAWPLAEVGSQALADGDAEAVRLANERMAELVQIARDRHARTAEPGSRLKRVLELDMRQVEAEQERMLGTSNASSWEAVADGWHEVGRPFRVAMARWRQAEAAESVSDRTAMITALRHSFAIATELGAKPLLEHLESMSRRVRVRLTEVPVEGTAIERPYGLTAREAEVLREVAASRTNREIAESLFISESTAGVHVSNILGKLGVSSRSEAARLARSEGLATE